MKTTPMIPSPDAGETPESQRSSPPAGSGLMVAGLDLNKLVIGEPFSIPQHVLMTAPSIAGVSQVVRDLAEACKARGMQLSEWVDGPTGDHVFKVDRANELTMSKLMAAKSILNGDARLS